MLTQRGWEAGEEQGGEEERRGMEGEKMKKSMCRCSSID